MKQWTASPEHSRRVGSGPPPPHHPERKRRAACSRLRRGPWAGGLFGSLLLFLTLCCIACGTGGDPADATSPSADSDSAGAAQSALDGPEGIRVIGDRVFVTSTAAALDDATGTMTYGQGYVSALDRDSLDELGRVDTPWLNPQTLVVTGEGPDVTEDSGASDEGADIRAASAPDGSGTAAGAMLAVVCSGRLEADDSGRMLAATPGGVLLVDPQTLEILGQVEVPAGTPGLLGGFPGSAVFDSSADILFAGSGIGPYVYRVDLDSLAVESVFTVHPESETNDLVVPALAGGILYVSSQRTGMLYRLDPATGASTGEPIDITKTDAYEGPIDIAVTGSTLYVLSTISSRVAAVDLGSGEVTYPFAAGAAPNRLLFHEGTLYVVNSLDNNLTRFDPVTGKAVAPFAPLPVGTNPWEMAAQGATGYITGYLDDTVYAVSLEDGSILATSR